MKVRGSVVLGAGAALTVGYLVVRRLNPSFRLNRLLNGNLRLFTTSSERRRLSAIAAGPKRYLLQGWPKPGINDAQKRTLVAALGDEGGKGSEAAAIESARLRVLHAPRPPRHPTLLEHHGHSRTDHYYWLRDDDRANSHVIAHLEAENAYTRSVLSDTEELQQKLYKELRGRIKEADQSAPQQYRGFWYYTRTEQGAQYAVHCRRQVSKEGSVLHPELDVMDEEMSEQVLLDENKDSKGHSFYMVGGFEVSPDQKRLAYGVDTKGNEMFTLHVKDLATGKELMSRPIPDTAGAFAWAADNETLFYVTKDPLDRPYKVWRHVVGSDPKDDELVYHEEDEAFYVGISSSRSEKVLYIHSGSAVTSDVRWLPSNTPTAPWQLVLPRQNNVEYSVDDRGDEFIITIRDSSRPNSEVLVAPMSNPSASQKVIIPHRKEAKIEHVVVSNDYLVSFERINGLQQAIVYSLPSSNQAIPAPLEGGRGVAFDEPAYELSPGSQGDFDSPLLRFHYESLTTPDTVVDFNMATGARATKKVQPVLGGFDKSRYHTERLFATAPDGTKVPISLVYRKDLARLDGSDPLLLDAYGSYEIPNDADFRSSRLSLLDRGVTFAIAHVRGGGDLGRMWYEDGKFLKKKNTFTDFVACAEFLCQLGYTRPSGLCIQGRSAGGLTMGAVINLRPDLFHAAILGVPFVDCLTTMLDPSIPLTTIEWEEWGNPVEDKEYYDYMLTYSPVDNVQPNVKYPNMLVTGGLHDPRVGYWEPAKYVAKVREVTAPGSMVLLKCEMGAGHFSQSGRFDRLKEIAVEQAFLLKCLGMIDTPLS